MPREQLDETMTEDRRKAIFLALVEAQDQGKTVAESRAEASRQFDVTEDQVRAIEREGLDNEWPPL